MLLSTLASKLVAVHCLEFYDSTRHSSLLYTLNTRVQRWLKSNNATLYLPILASFVSWLIRSLTSFNIHTFGTGSCGIWKWIGVQARCVNERSARDSWHMTSATSSGQKCCSAFCRILRSYRQNNCSTINIFHFSSLFINTFTSDLANQKSCSCIDRKVRERRKLLRALAV